ncbi:MAG: cellulose biosynthesis protein BcsS, partial [Methyloceanibacter sp.]
MWGRCERVVGACLRASGAGALCFLALSLFAPAVFAQSDQPTAEIFTGLEASDNYASVYVGGGTALGKGLYEPGFRLRAVASFGRYHYDGTLLTDGAYVPTTFDGEDAFLAALAGYQFRKGSFIAKLFAGIEAEDQHISPHDPNNSVQG